MCENLYQSLLVEAKLKSAGSQLNSEISKAINTEFIHLRPTMI